MRYTPYALPSIVSAVVMFLLFVYVLLYRRRSTGAWQFTGIMVCCITWSFCYAMSLMYVDLNGKVFWFNLAQIGPDLGPIFWFLLTLEYTGRSDMLRRKWIAALFVLPLITTLIMWTNDWHHLLRRAVTLISLNENVTYLSTQRGPWFIVETAYAYVIIAATLYCLVRFVKWSSSKKQTLILIFAFLLPIFSNLLDIFKVNPLKPFGSTSIVFSLTGLILAWGLFRQNLLDITPIALNKVLENIGDGVIVLDDNNRIVDINPAACRLCNPNYNLSSEFISRDIRKVLPGWPEWEDQTAFVTDTKVQLALNVKEERRFFDVTVSPLYENNGLFIGWVSIFHDITEGKEANERLQIQLNEIRNLQVQLRDQALRDPLNWLF